MLEFTTFTTSHWVLASCSKTGDFSESSRTLSKLFIERLLIVCVHHQAKQHFPGHRPKCFSAQRSFHDYINLLTCMPIVAVVLDMYITFILGLNDGIFACSFCSLKVLPQGITILLNITGLTGLSRIGGL